MSPNAETSGSEIRTGVRILRLALTTMAIVALFGAAAGFWAGHRNSGGGALSAKAMIVIGLWALAIALLLIPTVRDIRGLSANMQDVPRRERVSLRLLVIAMGAGVVGGMMAVVSMETGWLTDGNGTLSPTLAIIYTALLCTLAPWLTWRWWRAIDEHEQAAYTEGANLAGHFVMFAGLGWWILNRAKLVPEPDVIVLIVAMSFVWTGVWLSRRFL